MSVANYVSVFSAIIIGLAVADLATSFHKLMRNRDRVRWDWLIFAVRCRSCPISSLSGGLPFLGTANSRT